MLNCKAIHDACIAIHDACKAIHDACKAIHDACKAIHDAEKVAGCLALDVPGGTDVLAVLGRVLRTAEQAAHEVAAAAGGGESDGGAARGLAEGPLVFHLLPNLLSAQRVYYLYMWMIQEQSLYNKEGKMSDYLSFVLYY